MFIRDCQLHSTFDQRGGPSCSSVGDSLSSRRPTSRSQLSLDSVVRWLSVVHESLTGSNPEHLLPVHVDSHIFFENCMRKSDRLTSYCEMFAAVKAPRWIGHEETFQTHNDDL